MNDRQQAGAPEARLVSIQFDPSRPVTGDTLRVLVTVEGANPDENDVLIHWNVNGQDKEETGTVLQSSLHYGDWVTATAEFPGQGEKRQLLSASVFVENAPPIIGIARESTDDGEYVAVLQTEDPEKDAVALRLVEAPEGMILDTATKTLRWRPDSNLSANVFQVTVEGVDSAGNIARYRFDISVSRP
ncbi:putative Ig domain-containing protein [Desulfosoma caldarium]|uniref:putative Ig domain-containing protein n=1 Tax=Desulfosoma caldarium TaxID=610254 RepID=UPI0011CE1532|nr:putative Ig domain-containing protein [Desulfosoma caldarium]